MTFGQIALWGLVVGFVMSMVIITGFAYTTLLERKVLARMQARVGPNRAGYIPLPGRGGQEKKLLAGFLQPAADAVKLFFKEDPTPGKADKVVYNIAPMLAVIPAILILAVIPWAGKIPGLVPEQYSYFAIVPGLNVAVLFVFVKSAAFHHGRLFLLCFHRGQQW